MIVSLILTNLKGKHRTPHSVHPVVQPKNCTCVFPIICVYVYFKSNNAFYNPKADYIFQFSSIAVV